MQFFLRKILTLYCCFFAWIASAQLEQATDTTDLFNKIMINSKNRFINNVFNDAINSMRKTSSNDSGNVEILIEKSEERFNKYKGRIIRYIFVQRYDFERTFTDTSNRVTYFGTRLLNSLHTDTKEFVIRQNLFMKEHTKLNAYELADNERYLRTLSFIQDVRIFTVPVKGSKDSVDILTKDLFTLSAVVDASVNSVKLRISESNLAGMAQRVQATGLWEQNRNPKIGYELLYSKTNIGGTFINSTIAYSQIDGGRSDGTEPENAFLIRLERPLVSPFSHVAGGLEVSFNQAENVYKKPDSLFFNYRYNYYDAWVGYNLGTKRMAEYANYSANRTRFFVAARYFKADFKYAPAQIGETFDPIYNTRQAALGQLTIFKQDFYKLNYIYGFGTTEDVPTGYSISITGGWHKQLTLERPYGGIQLEHYLVTPKGGFINSSFKTGGFLHNGKFQDASTLASVNFFTRIFNLKKWKLREYAKFSYTQLNDRITYEPLRINNNYGLNEFRTDSINGNRRISIYSETILYLHRKLFGFRFAPFVFGDFSLISFEQQDFDKSDGYVAIGAGLRTRNENLVFGTIELKALYFPRTILDLPQFRILVSSDLRFRYQSNFVRAPNIIYLNRDDL
ncbi:MAG TPA: hypothetical protein PL009_12615 [Flavipsychrobacter sp.]|nr:hypothetical protein [Flavipsychrobacter sp.]